MHDFANKVIGVITGTYGPFGTEIAFARKHGPGRKSQRRVAGVDNMNSNAATGSQAA